MASSKKGKPKGTPAAPAAADPISSEATATMLSFANPPTQTDPQSVAADCSRQAFAAIGINIGSTATIIDFSTIDSGMCADLAASIETCVDSKNFFVPALTGTMQVLNQKSVQITFINFAKGIAQLLKPKGDVPL
jgi:hypothetical protein